MIGPQSDNCTECKHFGGWFTASLASCLKSGSETDGYCADGCQDYEYLDEDEED